MSRRRGGVGIAALPPEDDHHGQLLWSRCSCAWHRAVLQFGQLDAGATQRQLADLLNEPLITPSTTNLRWDLWRSLRYDLRPPEDDFSGGHDA